MDRWLTRIENIVLSHDLPYHQHDASETQLMVVQDGSVIQTINGAEVLTKKGDVYVLGENCAHGFHNVDHLRIFNVIFNMKTFNQAVGDLREMMGYQALFVIEPKLGQQSSYKHFMHLNPGDLDRVSSMIRRISDELEEKRPGYCSIVDAELLLLVAHLSRQYEMAPADTTGCASRLAQAVAYMESHYMDPITRKDLANAAHLSERQLSRVFGELYQMPPIDYLNHLRVDIAKKQLLETDRSVTEIALQCGFNEGAYFSRVFRKMAGCSPLEFRKRRFNY